MPHVKMRVKPGGSLTELAREQPDAEIRFVASWPAEDGLLGIAEVQAATPETVAEFIDEAPEIQSTEVLHREQQRLLLQFLMPTDPAPHHAALSSEMLPQFPMIVRNGWIISETTVSHDRLAQYKAELDAAGVTYEVISLTQSLDPTTLLTDRQHQFVTEAIERGYYDNPRECSLTDLAAALDVNKATASGILHRAEGRIIKEFIGEPVV